jgi:predicted phosphohydrolase
MLYIGDVHGKWEQYYDLIRGREASIQVGDMAVGFPSKTHSSVNRFREKTSQGDHRFIRGNHDNPEACSKEPSYIASGQGRNPHTFFLGGAYSIDRSARREDWDWWENEEHSYSELSDLISSYETSKPSIMITHDCPETVARHLFSWYTEPSQSRTRAALETCFEIHKPDLWIFGHWHASRRKNLLGTEFICLNELETIEI